MEAVEMEAEAKEERLGGGDGGRRRRQRRRRGSSGSGEVDGSGEGMMGEQTVISDAKERKDFF